MSPNVPRLQTDVGRCLVCIRMCYCAHGYATIHMNVTRCSGCSWMLLDVVDVLGCAGMYLDVHGCTWMCWDVLRCAGMYLDVLGCTWM